MPETSRQPEPPEDDPYLEGVLNEVAGSYQNLMPPELLAAMRENLQAILATHPHARELVKRSRPREAPDRSGKRATPDAGRADGANGTPGDLGVDKRAEGGG